MNDPADDADARRRALASHDARVCLAALEALARDGAALDDALALAVVECLGVDVKSVQRRASDVLRLTGDAARPAVLAALRTALAAPDPCRRWGAAYALGQLGIVDAALVAPLIETLASRDGDRRWAAAALMVACGGAHAEAVVPALLAALHADAPELRKMALYVLRDLAPGGDAVARALLAALRDVDAAVRLAALSALARLPSAPEDACAEALRVAREDAEVGVRRAAVSVLGRLGRGVPEAEELISAALGSDDAGLRRAAEAARRQLTVERGAGRMP